MPARGCGVSAVEVLVVGAGPAGQTLALALRQAGVDVHLLDAAPGPALDPVLPDLRVFALSRASTRLLASVAAWPSPQAARVQAYRGMQVWERDPDHGLRFDAASLGWSALGHIVEHGVLQQGLAEQVVASDLPCQWGVRVEGLTQERDHVELSLDNGKRIAARLVVAADGGGSPVRRLSGIEADRVDYHQCGLVANVRGTQPHAAIARQRFLPTGPVAWLPLSSGDGQDCSIVWSLPEHEANRLQAVAPGTFERELAIAAGGLLGTFELLGDRGVFPLARQLARTYHQGRVVLVADAAHVVHPLAGQGLNLGLLDVAVLAEVLDGARRRRLDLGDAEVLGRYARWRQGDNALAARAFECVDGGWRAQAPGLPLLRELGLRGVNRLPPLKHRLMLHAAGLAGRVPSRCAAPGTSGE